MAVKILRVLLGSDMGKIRNVGSFLLSKGGAEPFVPTVLQGGCDLEFVIPSKYLGALWCLGEYQLPQFFYHYRTDGTWKHYAVHQSH